MGILGNPPRIIHLSKKLVLLAGTLLPVLILAYGDGPLPSPRSLASFLNSGAAAAPPAAAPVIGSPNGVLDGATFDPSLGIAGGSWVSIFGTGLAPKTRAWAAADFVGGRAPTALEGVSVKINGKPAYVAFLMRGADFNLNYDQINVLSAVDETTGSVPVTVTTPQGTSAPVTVTMARARPAFFPFEPEGRRYLASSSGDGAEYIGKFALFGSATLDRPIRPAHAAEVITLYGSGFGATDPPIPEGSLAQGAARLVKPVSVYFGTEAGVVEYAGIAPGLAGVYQFNVRVPAVAAGDVEIIAEIDGVRTPAGRYLTIADVPYPGFNHSKFSDFKLTGAHVFVDCTQCHLRSRFLGTPAACKACHLEQYQNTTSPNHAASGFPTDCAGCHLTSRFQGAAFGHTAGKFPLTGAHAALQCSKCHTAGQYEKLNTACASCHLPRYQRTTNPNHAAAGFSQDCAACHNTTSFAGAVLDHSKTAFPLTGRHTGLQCISCHASGQYDGLRTDCASCHLARYQQVTNPNHVAGQYPLDCALCHNTAGFKGASFDHARTHLPLTGAHAALACANCHTAGQYSGLKFDCASCHLARYSATTNPNHAAAGFPADCKLCHSTVSFAGATFNHATTGFSLTGAHVRVQCAGCHVSGQYAGLKTVCSACHLSRYNATTSPNHVAAGFPTDCALCHSTSQFLGARFVHSRFALTGAHQSLACSKCHGDGVFAGKSTACSSCHLAKYNATTNPNHVTLAFPKDCAACHTTTQWAGAVFTHAAFPIYSGKHAGKWTSCAICHTNPANYKEFSCLGCHTKAATDSKHSGRPGYVYASPNCYACHPAGKGD